MSDLTLKQLSRIVGRHVKTLQRLARKGKLPGVYKLGRKWSISKAAANELRRLPGAAAPERSAE